jgi:hypothetical protein
VPRSSRHARCLLWNQCARDGIAMMSGCCCLTRSRCSRTATYTLSGRRPGPISDVAMAPSPSRWLPCSPQAAPFTRWTVTARHCGEFRRRTNDVRINTHRGDFTKRTWPFADLDGILMANSLHYVADQAAFIRACEERMTMKRRFLIVEYDTNDASRWVPHPVSQERLTAIFASAGYWSVRILRSRPSIYRRASLYAAAIVSSK